MGIWEVCGIGGGGGGGDATDWMLVSTEVVSDDCGAVSPLGAGGAGVETTVVSVGRFTVGQMVMVAGTAVMMAGFSGTLAAQMPVK